MLTDDEALGIYKLTKEHWNIIVDDYNKWDTLSEEEKALLIINETEAFLREND